MAERLKLDLEVDRLRLIDVSSEDDCLISSPSGFLEDNVGDDCFDLFVVGDAQEREDTTDFLCQRNQEPMSSEPMETNGARKNGKCNLRKSLAWDSAFLTNEGVLDPEELSILNNGMKKTDRCPLPGIQEDLRISAESNSTLGSDTLTLENLEVDLFEDVRASIQRSSKASNVASTNIKAVPGVSAMKKAELACRNKMKPVVSKRQSISAQGTEKTKKEAVIRTRLIQPASGELNTSSLKPPKILGRTNPVSATPTKRSSLGPNRVKIENNNAKAASVAGSGGPIGVSKKAGLGGSSVIPKTTASSKLSSGSSPPSTKLKPAGSGSPHNTSGSTSSDSSAKSPLKILRRKTDPRNVIPVSGSTLKAPLRLSTKSSTESENSRLLTYLKSTAKPSSSISPASSMDGWSTESSSSTSTVNQWSNSLKANTGVSSPCKGLSLDRNNNAPQTELKNRLHDTSSSKRASLGTSLLSHPASTNASKSFKPSGLRMPSPKIGFFDAEKSLEHSPKVSSQLHSGARSGLPKTGTGIGTPKEGSIKAKPGKLQLAKTLSGSGNTKFVSHEAGLVRSCSSPKPTTVVQLQEPSSATPKFSGTSRTREKCPGTDSKVQNDSSLKTGRENHWKSGEIGELPNMVGSKQDSVSNAKKVANQYAFMNDDMGNESAIKIISSVEGLHGQGYFENNQRSLNKGNEKENLFYFKDQVDGLSKQVAGIDLKAPDILKDTVEKKGSSLSQLDVNNLDDPGDPKLASPNTSTLLVHSQEDFQKILSKSSPLSLSPNPMDGVVSNTRIPLASNVYFGNKNGSMEPALDSTMEATPSACVLPECIQKVNS